MNGAERYGSTTNSVNKQGGDKPGTNLNKAVEECARSGILELV
jgi:hypothetical protein